MTDRDEFAAAALTGLLSQGDDGLVREESYARAAYRWADVMLRAREAPQATGEADMSSAFRELSAATERTLELLAAEIARLRLTDAEREAIELFATLEWTSMRWSKVEKNAATLRKLLERMK